MSRKVAQIALLVSILLAALVAGVVYNSNFAHGSDGIQTMAATYKIYGTVINESGNPLPAGALHVYNIDTKIANKEKTIMNGSYETEQLNPGTYKIEIIASTKRYEKQVTISNSDVPLNVDLRTEGVKTYDLSGNIYNKYNTKIGTSNGYLTKVTLYTFKGEEKYNADIMTYINNSEYTIKGVAPGTYRLRVECELLVPNPRGSERKVMNQTITVGDGNKTQDIKFDQGYKLFGKLTDANGDNVDVDDLASIYLYYIGLGDTVGIGEGLKESREVSVASLGNPEGPAMYDGANAVTTSVSTYDSTYVFDEVMPGIYKIKTVYNNIEKETIVEVGLGTKQEDIQLPDKYEVFGYLYNESGGSLNNVYVHLYDSKGNLVNETYRNQTFPTAYHVENVEPGTYTLIAWYNYSGSKNKVITLPITVPIDTGYANKPERQVHDIQFTDGSYITGNLTDANGDNVDVSNATIKVYHGGLATRENIYVGDGVKDHDNVYKVNDLMPGTYRIEATYNGITKSYTVEVGESYQTQDIQFARDNLTIQGKVEDQNGLGIQFVSIELEGSSKNYGPTTTNASGYYDISNVTDGSYTIKATTTSGRKGTTTIDTTQTTSKSTITANTIQIDYRDPAYKITGTITANGSPVDGITVEIKDSSNGSCGTAKTSGGGKYEFPEIRLKDGSYTLEATHKGQTGQTKFNTSDASSGNLTNVNVDIEVLYTVTGKITVNGNTINNATAAVKITDSSGGSYGTPEISTGGTYTISNAKLKDGPYTLEATYEGQTRKTTLDTSETSTGSLTKDVDIEAVFNVTGKVIDHTDAGIQGASVVVKGSNSTSYGPTTTESSGMYSISNVPNGTYTIEASINGKKNTTTIDTTQSTDLTINANDIEIDLRDPAYNITGTITVNGTPVDNLEVKITDSKNTDYDSTRTNSDGEYEFSEVRLKNGEYIIEANYNNQTGQTKFNTSDASLGNLTDIDVDIKAVYNVTGTIKEKGGAGLTGVAVTVLQGSSPVPGATTTTGEGGTYTITGLKPGSYNLKAVKGTDEATKLFSISNKNETVDLEIEITKSVYTEDPVKPPVTPGEDGELNQENNMIIVGNVSPISMIDITVPATITFTIDKHRMLTINGADKLVIKSDCPSPLNVNILSITPGEDAPKPVSFTDRTDEQWNNLTKTKTHNEIAMQLNNVDLSTLTDGSQGKKIGNIESAFSDPKGSNTKKLDLNLDVKYGKAWGNTDELSFDYNIVFEFEMP